MCPDCECVLASSGELDADEAPSENVSREWVCSGFGKLDADKSLFENVSSKCVSSGLF